MPVQIGAPRESSFEQPFGLLTDCHRRIEMFLGALVRVADQAQGRPLTPEEAQGLEKALRYFRDAASKHTADEEESLFPRLRPVADADTLAVLDSLEADHDKADQLHRRVDEIGAGWLRNGQLEAGAYAGFRDAVETLASIYKQHIALEDKTLFPEAARLIEPAAQAEIGREMAMRRERSSCL